jgi:hypothetical protein
MSATVTVPYLSRHVVAALKRGGFHAYTGPGTTGFKVYSFHGGTPHVQCYGARQTETRQHELAAYQCTLTAAGFVCVNRGDMLDVTGRIDEVAR